MKSHNQAEIINLLVLNGFKFKSNSKHIKYECTATGLTVAIPHSRVISPGTSRDIIRTINRANKLKGK